MYEFLLSLKMLYHKANALLVIIFSFSSFSPSILPSMLLLLTNAEISFSQLQTEQHKRNNNQKEIENPDFSVLSSFTSHFIFENVGLKPHHNKGYPCSSFMWKALWFSWNASRLYRQSILLLVVSWENLLPIMRFWCRAELLRWCIV